MDELEERPEECLRAVAIYTALSDEGQLHYLTNYHLQLATKQPEDDVRLTVKLDEMVVVVVLEEQQIRHEVDDDEQDEPEVRRAEQLLEFDD